MTCCCKCKRVFKPCFGWMEGNDQGVNCNTFYDSHTKTFFSCYGSKFDCMQFKSYDCIKELLDEHSLKIDYTNFNSMSEYPLSYYTDRWIAECQWQGW
jgi:hypothetical protein